MHVSAKAPYFVTQSTFMQQEQGSDSLQTLHEIRSIMERSARFISLSGWSGIWAGSTALAGAFIAGSWLNGLGATYGHYDIRYHRPNSTGNFYDPFNYIDNYTVQFLALAAAIFIVALAGGFFFTWRKVKNQGHTLWNHASRQLLTQVMLPLVTGGIFCLAFLYNGNASYIGPACLVFYGLALINGSKYTLSDIRYLGMLEVALGCICLFFPGYSLYFWAAGFGILHILYGIIMWNKYDKQTATR